jgi:MFS family permease
VPTWIERLLPPSKLARTLSIQSILFAVGEGTFLTGSAVFFTHIVGLSAAQVGLGLTCAGAVSFLLAVPSGKLADRFGPKRMWAVGALLTAALYAVWPLIHGFSAYLVMITLLEVVDGAGSSGRGAYTLDVFTREERVRSLAFMRSALNIGFTLGALFAGVALATNSDAVVRAVPLGTAVILVVNAFWITRLPDATHDRVARETPAATSATSAGSAMRNRGFLGLSFFDGILGNNQVLLNVVIPLWLVQETDAPRVLLAWLFGTNTVLAVLLQVRAARGADTLDGALRASRISGGFFVLSCLIVMVTHQTVGWVTIFLVWIGHVTVTGAELFQSAGSWGYQSELSDPDRRGEYQGVSRLGHTLGYVWAPALFTFLAMNWGTPGWLLIAGITAVAVVMLTPCARAAERYLQRTTEQHPATTPT